MAPIFISLFVIEIIGVFFFVINGCLCARAIVVIRNNFAWFLINLVVLLLLIVLQSPQINWIMLVYLSIFVFLLIRSQLCLCLQWRLIHCDNLLFPFSSSRFALSLPFIPNQIWPISHWLWCTHNIVYVHEPAGKIYVAFLSSCERERVRTMINFW